MSWSPSSIYLFAGQGLSQAGVDTTSVFGLKELLKENYPNSQLTLVNNDDIKTSNWQASSSLFVLPGGRCSEWTWTQSQVTIEKVKCFVHQGGKVLGVCAGAYCLSEQSTFHPLGEHPIISRRGLDLFSGVTIGPLSFSHSLPVRQGMSLQAAKVQLTDSTSGKALSGYVSVVGGGCFIPNENPIHRYTVLARYSEQPEEKKIAAVASKVGVLGGCAVLSFPHWEYNVSKEMVAAAETAEAEDVYVAIQCDREFQQRSFQILLRALASPAAVKSAP